MGSAVTVYAAVPAVTSLSPVLGPTGGDTPVTIKASGFTGGVAVRFGGTLASYAQVVDDNTVRAFAPPHPAGQVDVTLGNSDGTSARNAGDRYTYGNYSYTTLTGTITSPLCVSSWGARRLDVFGRGSDGTLWHRFRDGAWSGWASLGGGLSSDSLGNRVGAVAWTSARIDVMVRGTGDGLWHKWWDGSRWSGWESLGGVLRSGPAVASWSPGRLDVFVRGMDGALWHKWWGGSGWSGWESQGGVFSGDPGAASWSADRVDVMVHGSDNAIWHKSWDGTRWNGWESLSEPDFYSSADVAAAGPGVLWLFAVGPQPGQVFGRLYYGSWRAWRSYGNGQNNGDVAVASSAYGSWDLFVRNLGSPNSFVYATGDN
jgi:hypothetical protein